jgi:hypothetical protein
VLLYQTESKSRYDNQVTGLAAPVHKFRLSHTEFVTYALFALTALATILQNCL